MNVDFFERLIAERKRLGWRQIDMAEAGGVASSTYSNYEKAGGRMPDANVLMTWATNGVDVQYLLTGLPETGSLTNAESNLLSLFRALDERGQGAVLGTLYGYNNPEAAIAVTIGNVHAVNSVVNISGVNKL
ncbi:helix-turn-helix domain-containing protein [Rivihabitans pingtungensis]|uniref:Xre family transcriptional regulator n=1 Tax=Rivihabitans pingtungensis TaxID=1054498 RepID=A0A318KM80_9NEIS|nr:helix-turn-helix domain-containing protein [Rivihabitans pingtungensis]PXX79134.1 Xre family transcriptional regulator [Rivihabitans pingtungensis]